MPVIRTRYSYTKVYRPNGTWYAEARHPVIATAIEQALEKFITEFGAMPAQRYTVIEVIGALGDWIAQVFEVKD